MVENCSNYEKAVSTGFNGFQVADRDGWWMERFAIVPQNEVQAVAKPFHFEPHGFDHASVRMADDVRASFVERHDDSGFLFFTKSRASEKIPHAFAHFCELGGFA